MFSIELPIELPIVLPIAPEGVCRVIPLVPRKGYIRGYLTVCSGAGKIAFQEKLEKHEKPEFGFSQSQPANHPSYHQVVLPASR